MEPGHEDREYVHFLRKEHHHADASMEPGHEDREYPTARIVRLVFQAASMEPGHEDREYRQQRRHLPCAAQHASMEPGHEDREYLGGGTITTDADGPQWSPVMKTGNTRLRRSSERQLLRSLNGARS